MEASKVRKQRLKQWIDEEFEGRFASFCRYYALPESNASYLSQPLSGHRSFGERAVRKLEKACRRPAGWLDVSPVAAEIGCVFHFERHSVFPGPCQLAPQISMQRPAECGLFIGLNVS